MLDYYTNNLKDVIVQILDDMGTDGCSVREVSKQRVIKAIHAHYCPDFDYDVVCETDSMSKRCTCNDINK